MKELEKALEVFGKLPFTEQQEWLAKFREVLSEGVSERKRQLQAELRELEAMEGPSARSAPKAKGQKLAVKYRSKKDPTKGWAGRGETPRWLREEMEASRKPLEFFRVDE